ncbi:MAG: TonB-dependent receptor, partial [Prevotella sp.]|nr:TonB-dependent receptor [Prevotella sp.]
QIRYKNIGNFERTGQAWNGVTAGNGDYSLMDGSYDDGSWTYNAKTGIHGYKDMYNVGLGRYNTLYEKLATGDDGLFVKDANGNYLTERYKMADGSLWEKTTDNFWQNHNIISAAWDINDYWTTTASLHYTYGHGYYNEFRYDNKLYKFGMTATDDKGKNIKRTDFVREKGLTQHSYGVVWNANYEKDNWDVIGGFSIQNFDGNHFGYVTYTANDFVRQKYLANGDYKYYDSDAHKFDANIYLKAAYNISERWEVFADMQYRHVGYRTDGINDKFYEEGSGYYNQQLDINKKYDFFNPKAGFSWTADGHRVYGSMAMSHREPERNNFTDNGKYPAPEAERLMDYELGYTYTASKWHAGVNLYYMDYKDQFVQTGQLSDIGENLTTNIKDSYRMGIELQAGVAPLQWLSIEGNAALSKNKIKDFDEKVNVDWKDDVYETIHYDNSTLAFSPSAILNGFINFHWKDIRATWHTNFVSRQYLDNTENYDRSLPCYSVTNVKVNYTLKPKKYIRECIFGLNFNNIFNRRYASSGWVYSAILKDYGDHPNDNRYYQIGFIPMAGFTMMGNVTLRF